MKENKLPSCKELPTVLTSCMTSSRDVKVLSADRTVLEMIPLNFLTSKTYKITPKTLLYDFYSL